MTTGTTRRHTLSRGRLTAVVVVLMFVVGGYFAFRPDTTPPVDDVATQAVLDGLIEGLKNNRSEGGDDRQLLLAVESLERNPGVPSEINGRVGAGAIALGVMDQQGPEGEYPGLRSLYNAWTIEDPYQTLAPQDRDIVASYLMVMSTYLSVHPEIAPQVDAEFSVLAKDPKLVIEAMTDFQEQASQPWSPFHDLHVTSDVVGARLESILRSR